jgi:hypothetical protein
MPVFQYTYTVLQRAIVTADNISDAAVRARQHVNSIPDAKMQSIVRVDPPLDPAPAKKADAA